MIMRVVLNEKKVKKLGYTVESCYGILNRLFAEFCICPEQQGVYIGPDNQNMYNACSAALHRLPASSWFLKVVESWQWDLGSGFEDCLKAYNDTHN